MAAIAAIAASVVRPIVSLRLNEKPPLRTLPLLSLLLVGASTAAGLLVSSEVHPRQFFPPADLAHQGVPLHAAPDVASLRPAPAEVSDFETDDEDDDDEDAMELDSVTEMSVGEDERPRSPRDSEQRLLLDPEDDVDMEARFLFDPEELEAAALPTLRRLPLGIASDVTEMFRHPDLARLFLGSWRALGPIANKKLRDWWRRSHDFYEQHFNFIEEDAGLRCYVVSEIYRFNVGQHVVTDTLDLRIAYGPTGAYLRGKGQCYYFTAAMLVEPVPTCEYAFALRSDSPDHMFVERSSSDADPAQVMNRTFAAVRAL